MILPNGTLVAVADGAHLRLFRNTAPEPHIELVALDDPHITARNPASGGRHRVSAANPDTDRSDEDGFALAIADCLNRLALDKTLVQMLVIADPRTLGELRKHYHGRLASMIMGELPKDLAGRSVADIAKAIHHA